MTVPQEVRLARHAGDLDDDGHDTLAGGTVNASDVVFTPAGTIAATDVQAAIEEVAAEAGTNLFPPAANAGEGPFSLGGGYTEAGSGVTVVDGHRYRVTVLGWSGAGTSNLGVAFGASGVSGSDAWHTGPAFDTIPVVGTNMRLIGRNSGGNLVGTGWTYQDLADIPATGTILRYDGTGTEWTHPRVPTKAGVPTDADVIGGVAAVDGMTILDTTDDRWYYRSGGTWKYPSGGAASGVTFSPTGTIAATNVQAAIAEVATDAAADLAAHAALGSTAGTDHVHIDAVTYSGDGTTTAFELPAVPFDAWSVKAHVAGLRTAVTLSGYLFTTMTFGSAPAVGTDNVLVDIVAITA